MQVAERMNKAIQYIEANLENEISISEIAEVAGYSAYYFMRMFSAITGVGVMEYIRKRKMTKAAEELHRGNKKIIDIALTYGYESPTAFNRAFQGIHGISPSKARKEMTKLTSYLPISCTLTLTGGEKMEYRIETIESFRAVGYKRAYNFKNGENFEKIPQFWQEIMQSGGGNKLMALQQGKPHGMLGICGNMRNEDFDYFIAVASDVAIPEGMDKIFIDAQTYAIFPCTMNAIQDTTKRILAEWLPNSEYSHVEGAPELEVYPNDRDCEICIPIMK